MTRKARKTRIDRYRLARMMECVLACDKTYSDDERREAAVYIANPRYPVLPEQAELDLTPVVE